MQCAAGARPSIVVTLSRQPSQRERTGFDGLSIDIDGAGAALRRVATDMGSREVEVISQQINPRVCAFDRSGLTHAMTSIVTT